MNEPRLIFEKIAEKKYNRVSIPTKFIRKWGRHYLMYVYDDHIELKPIRSDEDDKPNS